MKTKFLKTIFAVLLCMVMASTFSSCGDDEPGDTSAVVGTWYGDDYDHFYSSPTITFKSNGTGTAKLEHYGSYISVRIAEFTYKVKGSTVTCKGTIGSANSDGESGTGVFELTLQISGNRLIVKSGKAPFSTDNIRSYKK